MAQEKPNPLSEWLSVARTNAPAAREHFHDWLTAVREEPRLLWETPVIRFTTYGIGGLLIAWLVTFTVSLFVPPPPAGTKAQAVTADYHVVCSEPSCGHHFVIHRPFGFHAFPVQCPACKRDSGAGARRCPSPKCAGLWVAPAMKENHATCPRCGTVLE